MDMERVKLFLKGSLVLDAAAPANDSRNNPVNANIDNFFNMILTRAETPSIASERLQNVFQNSHKQVCQYQFKKNDIVWICRECQADETCVLCNRCYQNSMHEGHEVYFYHSGEKNGLYLFISLVLKRS